MNFRLEHTIFQTISEVSEELNIKAYVVGGYVRDLVLQRPSKDVDFMVLGDGIDFAQAVAHKLNDGASVNVFRNFGTAMLKIDDWDLEFVGARKESYVTDSRKPTVSSGSFEDDIKRRDLTINSMAISLGKKDYGRLIDLFDGLGDIERKIIRTPLDPDLTFSDDPLRMLRAIRFSAQLQFELDETTYTGISKNAGRIQIISMERVSEELNKIILSTRPSIGFKSLFDTGLLAYIFPELVKLQGVETIDGLSHKDNFYHTLQVLDQLCPESNDLWLRWAALLHDIAKPQTKRFSKEEGWTFHGHEEKGARMVKGIFRRLRLPLNEKMKFVEKMVRLHLRPIVLSKEIVTDSAIRRLIFDSGDDVDSLMKLCRADITTKNEFKFRKFQHNLSIVEEKIKDVDERDKIRNWQPPIDGNQLMDLFDLKAGKEVGILKNALREAILDGQVQNNYEDALEFIQKKGEQMGLTLKSIL
ncbi:MAG: HD domain-containing protein [Flavobacteriales bacterium]|nr:HD domain-containing protein [Flavobacteriales bacterium]